MPDRESVIKGLESVILLGRYDAAAKLVARDALALLREQEPVEPERGFPDLKCPDCGTEYVSEVRYYLGEPIAEYYRYCPGCGRKVKWDA